MLAVALASHWRAGLILEGCSHLNLKKPAVCCLCYGLVNHRYIDIIYTLVGAAQFSSSDPIFPLDTPEQQEPISILPNISTTLVFLLSSATLKSRENKLYWHEREEEQTDQRLKILVTCYCTFCRTLGRLLHPIFKQLPLTICAHGNNFRVEQNHMVSKKQTEVGEV